MDKKASFYAEIWDNLSRIDCSKFVERKQNLSYLSWSHAWAILMSHYPESEFQFEPPAEFPDGTVEIWVTLTIKDGERIAKRRIWLPVLDHANRAVKNPHAFQINSTRMRCLTKCMAFFGLGHHIYTGESAPRPEDDAPAVGERRSTSVVQDVLDAGAVFDEAERDTKVELIDSCFTMDPIDGLSLVDAEGLDEALDLLRLDADMKVAVWQKLPSKVRTFIKARERA